MERTIISHDIERGVAVIRFSNGSVSTTQTYITKMLVPGTMKVLADLGMDFDEAAQLRAIDYLTRNMQAMADSGSFQGDPAVPAPVEEPAIEPEDEA